MAKRLYNITNGSNFNAKNRFFIIHFHIVSFLMKRYLDKLKIPLYCKKISISQHWQIVSRTLSNPSYPYGFKTTLISDVVFVSCDMMDSLSFQCRHLGWSWLCWLGEIRWLVQIRWEGRNSDVHVQRSYAKVNTGVQALYPQLCPPKR